MWRRVIIVWGWIRGRGRSRVIARVDTCAGEVAHPVAASLLLLWSSASVVLLLLLRRSRSVIRLLRLLLLLGGFSEAHVATEGETRDRYEEREESVPRTSPLLIVSSAVTAATSARSATVCRFSSIAHLRVEEALLVSPRSFLHQKLFKRICQNKNI